MHAFRFGVLNETIAPRLAWLDQVRRVESAGYATFLLRDHFVPDFFGDQYAPFIALMAAAAATRTLRVGTMVAANDYRHPLMLAKEIATLDALSDGRVELGIGAGWLRSEYEQAGLRFESAGTRIERLAEAIAVMTGLWRGEPFEFQGQHYQIAHVAGMPPPVQQPRPPILVGGGHRRMLTLAGQVADSIGVLTSSVASGTLVEDPRERMPAAVREKLSWIKAGAGERFAAIELGLIPTLIITDRRREATQEWLASKGWQGIAVEDAWSMPSVLIGSVDQVAEDLARRHAEYGFSYYVVGDGQFEAFAPVVARLAT
jgi:probable F420-dependent oxidoreductase